jgi:hypothetical protein
MEAVVYRARGGCRARAEKGSRRAVGWAAALFLLAEAAMGLATVTAWRGAADRCAEARFEALCSGLRTPGACNVVCLGSSRFMYGLQVDVAQSTARRRLGRQVIVHNWGTPDAGPLRHLLAWDRMERRGLRPDAVVIELLSAHLVDGHVHHDTSVGNLPTVCLEAGDLPLLKRYHPDYRALRKEYLRQQADWLYRYRGPFQASFLPWLALGTDMFRADQTPQLGTRRDLHGEAKERAVAVGRGQYGSSIRQMGKAGFAPVGRQILEELFSRLRSAGVPAFFVVTPESAQFRAELYPPGLPERMREFAENVTRPSGARLAYAHEWFDSEDDFFDSHHLASKGSDRFTERLFNIVADAISPAAGARVAR